MYPTKPFGQPVAAPGNLRQWLSQHPLLAYCGLAYAFSWIMTIPVVLAEWGYLPEALFTILFVVKAFAGPFVAALIMVNVTEGRAGLARFRQRFFQVRAGWVWYLFILLGLPALLMLGIIVQPGALASYTGLPNNSLVYFLVFYLINFVVIFFVGGPLAEEPGWRGFALPRLQTRFGPLWGTLILGVVWAFWHLPDFLTRAQGGGPGATWAESFGNLPIFVLAVVALAVIMTWVYNHTGGSIFIAILLHAAINATGLLPDLFPVQGTPLFRLGDLSLVFGLTAPALLIILLTRGRLGYQPKPETGG